MDSQTVSVRFAYRILRAAETRGIAAGPLAARAKLRLPPGELADAKIPTEAYLRLWTEAMAMIQDPAFPIDVASQVKASSHDVMGFAFMTADNLGEALQRAVRYLAIFTDSARWHQSGDGKGVRFTLARPGPARQRDPRWRPGDLFALAELVVGGRQVTGVNWKPRVVSLTQPRPQDDARLRDFFRAPVRFDCEQTSFVVDTEVLANPLQKADRELLAYFDRQADALLGRFDESDIAQQLRRLLMRSRGNKMITLAQAAAQLGMTSRSLHRHLQKRGVTFRHLVDEVRSSVAQQHLSDPRLTISEVAFLLGYSEPSAFHRAFHRWTGLTPQAFRGRK